MSLRAVVENVRNAVETPLTQPLDAVHLFWLIGAGIMFAIAWFFILHGIGQVARELE